MKPFKQYILPLLLLLVFTDSKAQILYSKAFGTSSWDDASDIIIGSDNNYMLLGTHFKNIYLAKADTIAQLIWEKSYPVDSNSLYLSSVCEIGDTSYVIAGNYQNEGFLLKVNIVGDSLFSLNDSTILGNNVTHLRQAPDGNLLALVTFNGIVSLVKFDDNLNVIARIDSLTPPLLRGIEMIGNTIYILKKENILLMINNELTQIDTVILPFNIVSYIRISSDSIQLIFEGTDTGIRKLLYTDLSVNINNICDTAFLLSKTDFKPVNTQNDWVYADYNYNSTWGQDIHLYFTDSCGQIVHDTILYRPGVFGDPWRDEFLVKLLVDQNGNYVIYGTGEKGPLGDWDILLWIYKKWDGFPTDVEEITNELSKIDDDIYIYPNPTQNQFTVSGITENSGITVTDVMGKEVYYIPNTNPLPSGGLGVGQTQISTTNWAKGLYIVQLKGNQSSTTLKVIKQ